jgi:hypothetical protein
MVTQAEKVFVCFVHSNFVFFDTKRVPWERVFERLVRDLENLRHTYCSQPETALFDWIRKCITEGFQTVSFFPADGSNELTVSGG